MPRQSAPNLSKGNLSLSERGGRDQVADRLCLDKIQPSIYVGPERELARMGKPGPRPSPKGYDFPKDYGAAMTGNLDDLLPGVGAWRREVSQIGLVDDPIFCAVENLSQNECQRLDLPPFFSPRPEYFLGNSEGSRPAQADRPEAPVPGRSGNRDDCFV